MNATWAAKVRRSTFPESRLSLLESAWDAWDAWDACAPHKIEVSGPVIYLSQGTAEWTDRDLQRPPKTSKDPQDSKDSHRPQHQQHPGTAVAAAAAAALELDEEQHPSSSCSGPCSNLKRPAATSRFLAYLTLLLTWSPPPPFEAGTDYLGNCCVTRRSPDTLPCSTALHGHHTTVLPHEHTSRGSLLSCPVLSRVAPRSLCNRRKAQPSSSVRPGCCGCTLSPV